MGTEPAPLNYYNYFTEVEEHFQLVRGSCLFLLSPLDWALLETWKNAGVPLEAVLRGIDAAFEKWRAKKVKTLMVNSLAFCAQAVLTEARIVSEAGTASREPQQPAAVDVPPAEGTAEDFPIGWELRKESWHFHRRFYAIFRRPLQADEDSAVGLGHRRPGHRQDGREDDRTLAVAFHQRRREGQRGGRGRHQLAERDPLGLVGEVGERPGHEHVADLGPLRGGVALRGNAGTGPGGLATLAHDRSA